MTDNNVNIIQDTGVLLNALQWYIDNGVDEALLEVPVDRTAVPDIDVALAKTKAKAPINEQIIAHQAENSEASLGGRAMIEQAQKIAAQCDSLEALKQAIEEFDGVSIKKTATNMVFSDGLEGADTMLIGDAPGADEDAAGKPFVGLNGALQDKIMAAIGFDRASEEPEKAVYLTNIMNWRPPGNRTPTQSELEISLAFLERHIALVKPKRIILLGGTTAKMVLKSTESMSKLRGKFHDYQPVIAGAMPIECLVTYHPTYLLNTPNQKKAVWADMLLFKTKL